MKRNTRKMVLNSILLAMGLILHQITPAIGLPIQPDIALTILFTIIVLNKDDYKSCLVSGVVTGIFTALTTKFPAGQLPNIMDKIITMNLIYIIVLIISNVPFIKKYDKRRRNMIIMSIILPIGTFISGCIFLFSAKILVGLPNTFWGLFMIAVAPAIVINSIFGIFLFKIVSISISRIGYRGINNEY